MEREHDEALEEFLAAFDRRLEAAPVVERRDPNDRRAQPGAQPVNGRRAKGPVTTPSPIGNRTTGPQGLTASRESSSRAAPAAGRDARRSSRRYRQSRAARSPCPAARV